MVFSMLRLFAGCVAVADADQFGEGRGEERLNRELANAWTRKNEDKESGVEYFIRMQAGLVLWNVGAEALSSARLDLEKRTPTRYSA
jgi:hypothetical protein